MNIMIVEDDKLLRRWLSMLLSSLREYQLQIYEAADGMDALETLAKTPVDLVFTDIKMPRMDGLQLIEHLRELYPKIRVVVLSAYNDFSYAKTAMQYGALDYILKAEMTASDLSQLLSKVQKDFQMESKLEENSAPDYAAVMYAQKVLTEFLASEDQPAPALLQSLCLNRDVPLMLTVLQLQNPNDIEIPILAAADICKRTLSADNLAGTAVPHNGDSCLLLYNSTENIAEFRQIVTDKLCNVLSNNLSKYLDLSVEFHISLFSAKPDDLRPSILQIYQLAMERKYYGNSESCTTDISILASWKDQLRKALEAGRFRDATAVLQAAVAQAHQVQLKPDLLRNELISMMNLFLTYQEKKQAFENKSPAYHALHAHLINTAQSETTAQLKQRVSTFLNTYIDLMQNSGLQLSQSVRSAIAYAEQHYAEKLSLDDVAGYVFMNRSYFCQVFKKETGSTFGDYVEHIRIQKAQELLETTDISVVSIAEQTGFQNQAYFTKVFKSVTGVNPLRYRKLHYQGQSSNP